MRRRSVCRIATVGLLLGVPTGAAPAQSTASEDEVLDAMRASANLSSGDQDRIARWIEKRLNDLAAAAREDSTAALKAFRARMNAQYSHANNSDAFTIQLAAQTAIAAEERFNEAKLNTTAARGLARVMADMGRPETAPGLVACLRTSDDAARFLCVQALVAQKGRLTADQGRFTQLVPALREAGLAESSPVVLGRLYSMLAQPNHVEIAFDTFMGLFDRRLSIRRGPAQAVGGAEIEAFEFFRTSGVMAALTNEQKAQLVRRLAVFLRLDAERYAVPELSFEEKANIDHLLWVGEEILAAAVGQQGGIRKELEAGGHESRNKVLEQVYAWVGRAENGENGVLSEAPWNVPAGAP